MLSCKPWYRDFDGWWYCTVRVDGKQRQRKLVQGRDNEATAEDLYHKLMLKLGHSRSNALSLPAISTQFLAAHENVFAPGTYDWYHRYLEDFCNYHPGEAVSVTRSGVLAWTRAKGWEDPSIRAAITCVKRLFNWAVEDGKLPNSPLSGLKRPPVGRREKLVSSVEHKAIMEKADRHFTVFLRCLRETGARPGEICRLTVPMVHLDKGLWIIPKHKTVKKTGKPRIIYLSLTMIELTKELLTKVPEGQQHLLRNKLGKPWTPNAVRCRMRRLREALDLPKGTVAYAYRHTFATEALDSGIAPQHVAKLLGHTDLSMLSTFYDHGDQKTDTLRQAAARASDALGE